MPEIVHWLAAEPVRWLVPLTLLAAVVGIPVMLWWERRHPPAARPLEAWRALPTEVQAAHDQAVVGASESAVRLVSADAEQIVRAEARRLARRSAGPKPPASSD
jgi:predicted membrane-bound mannosyltransferase